LRCMSSNIMEMAFGCNILYSRITFVDSLPTCLLCLLKWLGNIRACCTSKGVADCIEVKTAVSI